MHAFQIRKLISESDKLTSLVFKEFLVYISQEKYLEFFSLKEAALSLQNHLNLAESTDSIAQKMINLNIANACLSDVKMHLVCCVDMGYIREPHVSQFFNCLDNIVELLGIYRRASKQNLIKWDVQFDATTNSISLHKKQPLLYSKASMQSEQEQENEHEQEHESSFLGAAENISRPKSSIEIRKRVEKELDSIRPASEPLPIRDYIDNLVNKWQENEQGGERK